MPIYYRLFCLEEGRVTLREDFDAQNDEAAIAYARRNHPDSDCELLDLGRLVARIPAAIRESRQC